MLVLPVAVLLFGAAFLYAGMHNMSVTDVFRGALGRRSATGGLGNLDPSQSLNSSFSANSGFGQLTGLGTRGSVVAAALAQAARPAGSYTYAEVRPIPGFFGGHVTTDCSGFVTLCYKAAGAPDPNGRNYDGQGFTGTLEQRGTPTSRPQPGDLAFWSSPDHVGIYIGGGKVVEFGGGTKPATLDVQTESGYHQSFLGYRSYL